MSLFQNTGTGGSTSGSIFTGNNPGLFSSGANTITTAPSLFASITGGTSLFNQGTTSSMVPTGNTGLQTTGNTGLFSQTTGNTGLFYQNPGTSLFSQPTSTGSLFPQTTGAGLFSQTGNTGLFSQNPGSSLFSQTAPSTGLFSGGAGVFSPQGSSAVQPNLNYTSHASPMNKLIASLNENEKEFFYKIKNVIDNNESHFSQADTLIKHISSYKGELKERIAELFVFSKKVNVAEKRSKITVEILKKFQANVSNFVKDAIKVFNQCESADYFRQIESPAKFLAEMLENCEERLKSIEENFKEIEEVISIESESVDFSVLVSTIKMMQEKFQIVSSVAFDVHKRIDDMYKQFVHEKTEKKVKVKEVEKTPKAEVKIFSRIRDIISARSAYSGYY